MFKDKRRVVRWTARVLSLGPILFVLAEVLFPHSDPEVFVPWQEMVPVGFMFTSVIGLALAWRWERLGGWVSAAAFVLFLIAFWIVRGEFFPLAGLVPLLFVLVPAGLFLWCGYQERLDSNPKTL